MTSTFAPSRLAQDHAPVTRAAPLAAAVRDAAGVSDRKKARSQYGVKAK